MMNNLFNTTFETSLRVLLNLFVSRDREKTLDNIAACDFIATYSENFSITLTNLHGYSAFSFNEFATRRSLTSKALKSLVLNNLVSISANSNGFYYTINKRGIELCNKMNTEYAKSYMELCQITNKFLEDKTEIEILNLIKEEELKQLQRR